MIDRVAELHARATERIAACRRIEDDGADLRARQAASGWVSPAVSVVQQKARVERETWEEVLRILDESTGVAP